MSRFPRRPGPGRQATRGQVAAMYAGMRRPPERPPAMDRFPGTTIAEDRAAMATQLQDDLRKQVGRIVTVLAALDDYAWEGVAAPEADDITQADVDQACTRADHLINLLGPLLSAGLPNAVR